MGVLNSAELQWCMTQVSLGTSEKFSCGAFRFRCFNKRFDILLTLLLQGWGMLNSAAVLDTGLFGDIGEVFLWCFKVQVLQ